MPPTWKALLVFGGLGGLVGLAAFPLVRLVCPRRPQMTRVQQTLTQQAVDLLALLVAASLALVTIVGAFVEVFMLGLKLLE